MSSRFRILHLETGRNLYGGALQVQYLLRGLAENDQFHNVLVAPRESAIAETARDYVDRVHTVPMGGDLDLLFIPRLVRIIRKERPDIVHLHSRRGADVLGGIAARLTGSPCILTRRVDNPENRLWVGIKYRLYQQIVTISEGIREVLVSEGVPADKITCVRSAVDKEIYDVPCDRPWFLKQFGIEEGQLVCGVVAQFIERKGHRHLLKAIPEILRRVPGTVFVLFGKGPLEEDLKATCRDLGVEKQVVFGGFRDDLPRIFGCLDLLIHPALMEGLGVSLLQAAAAGVPIVGTRAGGIPEIVRDGINGLLVEPGNARNLAETVVKVLRDRDLSRRLGEGGKKIVGADFSITSMVEGNKAVYRELTLMSGNRKK